MLSVCMLAGSLPACAYTPLEEVPGSSASYDGLHQINTRRFDAAFVRPTIDFGTYKYLLVESPDLAFQTPDRSKRQFPLSDEQKSKFREELAEKFNGEFSNNAPLPLVDRPGAEVLVLRIRVQDILATVSPRSVSPVWNIALEAAGETTLVLELRDSESNEILARGFDRRVVEGAAMLQKAGPVTAWEDVEKLCEHWARNARLVFSNLIKRGGE